MGSKGDRIDSSRINSSLSELSLERNMTTSSIYEITGESVSKLFVTRESASQSTQKEE